MTDGAKNTSLRLHCSLVAILYCQSSAARVVNVWAPGLIGGVGMVMPQTVLLVILGGNWWSCLCTCAGVGHFRWEGPIGGPACVLNSNAT